EAGDGAEWGPLRARSRRGTSGRARSAVRAGQLPRRPAPVEPPRGRRRSGSAGEKPRVQGRGGCRWRGAGVGDRRRAVGGEGPGRAGWMRAGPVRYTHVDTLPGARGILVGIRGVATEDRSRMRVEAPPYGRPEIGRVRPGPGEVDAQVLDVRREGQLAGRSATSYQGVPPVKKPLWDWYLIPVYFWLGGIAGGSWLAAAAEAVAGRGDPGVFRAGRYLAFGGVAVGSGLLILDLGRPERFLNMLRV